MQSEYPGETRQCRPCQIGQILIWPHDLEVPVWVQVEQVEDLRQQLAVLAGYADFAIEIRSSRELPDYRSELYRFRSCPKDEQKLHLARELTMSETSHVNNDATHQLFTWNLPKPGMRHQQSNDIRVTDRLQRVAERDIRQCGQLFR